MDIFRFQPSMASTLASKFIGAILSLFFNIYRIKGRFSFSFECIRFLTAWKCHSQSKDFSHTENSASNYSINANANILDQKTLSIMF